MRTLPHRVIGDGRRVACLLLVICLSWVGCGNGSSDAAAGDPDGEAAAIALAGDYLEAKGRGDGAAICSMAAPEVLAELESGDCAESEPEPAAATTTVVEADVFNEDVALVTVRNSRESGSDALVFHTAGGKIVGVSSTEVDGDSGQVRRPLIVELAEDRRPAVSAVSRALGALIAGNAEKACAELDPDAAVGLLRGLRSLYTDDGVLPSSATCVEHIERAEDQQREHYDEALVDPEEEPVLISYAKRQGLALVTGSANDESGIEVQGRLLTAVQQNGRWKLLDF